MKQKIKYLLYVVLITLAVFSAPASADTVDNEQTQVSVSAMEVASDYTLGVFGNANEDETINMQDVTYTELIILEYKDETELADAKYDSEIDILDVTQIELTILGQEKELTLIDSSDRIVTVEKPVERIVFTHHATAEGILILGAGDRVVGREYTIPTQELFPELMELPSVTTGLGPYDVDYEKVFELDPDIFLTADIPMPGLEDVIATIEPEIPVVALNFFDPATMAEDIRTLGYVLNTKEEGDVFIAFYEGVINDIAEETAGLTDEEKPQVFLMLPEWTLGQINTFNDQIPLAVYLFGITGAINIAADLPGPGWVQEVDPEWLTEQNPHTVMAQITPTIIPGSFGYEIDDDSVAIAKREEIMAMDVFAGSDAVQNDRVYLYQCDLVTTPRCVVGIAYWAKRFHPELFSGLDPQAIHQQYLTDFLGIDHDLDEHGVFVYPEQ